MELEKVIRTIKESYHTGNGKEVSVKALVDAALEGLVSSLDKESMLMDRKPSSLEFIRGLREEGSIAEARFLGKNIGYIKIDFFGRRTGTDFKKALDDLEGMDGLIIDLRNNPGGVLQSALDVLGNLVPGGKLLLTEEHQKGRNQHFSQAETVPNLPTDLPIAVLINSSTASSAEIVAATLRHYRNALVVGQRSYAKGTIQEVIPLGARKTLILTTGEYILVDGSSLKGSGIAPDRLVKGKKEQLEAAVSLLKGR
ncbi:MAG: S41 family peptidase [Candidatus Brocadiales bacterium]